MNNNYNFLFVKLRLFGKSFMQIFTFSAYIHHLCPLDFSKLKTKINSTIMWRYEQAN
jgi:hypothetical protein